MYWGVQVGVAAVTGGKGGTGKSTIAINMAVAIANSRDVVLADLDVEAPNDHILLGIDLKDKEAVKIMIPFIDYSKCVKCGACAEVCDSGAILMPKGKYPYILPRLCSGCRACYFTCRAKAISEGYRVVGYTYRTEVNLGSTSITLVTGMLREGEEHVIHTVLAAKERAIREYRDVLIIDTAAGSGNNVTAAIEDSDIILAVTEPTPLGLHDLTLILELASRLGIEALIVINKVGIGPKDKIVDVAKKYRAKVIAEVPYSKDVVSSYINGVPLVRAAPNHPIALTFRKLGNYLSEVL